MSPSLFAPERSADDQGSKSRGAAGPLLPGAFRNYRQGCETNTSCLNSRSSCLVFLWERCHRERILLIPRGSLKNHGEKNAAQREMHKAIPKPGFPTFQEKMFICPRHSLFARLSPPAFFPGTIPPLVEMEPWLLTWQLTMLSSIQLFPGTEEFSSRCPCSVPRRAVRAASGKTMGEKQAVRRQLPQRAHSGLTHTAPKHARAHTQSHQETAMECNFRSWKSCKAARLTNKFVSKLENLRPSLQPKPQVCCSFFFNKHPLFLEPHSFWHPPILSWHLPTSRNGSLSGRMFLKRITQLFSGACREAPSRSPGCLCWCPSIVPCDAPPLSCPWITKDPGSWQGYPWQAGGRRLRSASLLACGARAWCTLGSSRHAWHWWQPHIVGLGLEWSFWCSAQEKQIHSYDVHPMEGFPKNLATSWRICCQCPN